ncbi:hypothetical protein E8E13_009710 [Curvularia kusanoi]|uniref:F-box domain-containing protein n=1 Tax=Curvularia kusanoi TaxID=90978 RepID=A0A9P4WB85_CURKU|nr:hypothetical protein E8E13_009710 [Curvularia kusanoi]
MILIDDLPQELIDNISSFLSVSDLSKTLTISPKFQIAAESCSRGFEKFTITEANADKFLSTYGGRRVRYLRRIRFMPMFPSLDTPLPEGTSPPCRDSASAIVHADEHFTSQIQTLFGILDSLQSKMKDSDFGDSIRLTIYTPRRLAPHYCLHRTYVSWRVHLLAPETLPTVKFIRTLVIKNGRHSNLLDSDIDQEKPSLRSLDLRILKDLGSKLPALQKIICKVGAEDWVSYVKWEAHTANHYRHIFEGPQRDSRHSFANAASQIQCKDLRDLDLDFMSPIHVIDWTDQRIAMPDLVTPALHDPFSTALRVLSYPIRRLNLRGVFDDTLFWPRDTSEVMPHWPNLEILHVAFHPVSPTGAWYFRGVHEPDSVEGGFEITPAHYPPYETSPEDEEVDGDDDNYIEWDQISEAQYRVVPNDELIEPFLTAFARATDAMPSLKVAAVWSILQLMASDMGGVYATEDYKNFGSRKLGWGVVYSAPGFGDSRCGLEVQQSANRQLWWKVANWRPTPRLKELIQGIGETEHKSDLKEYWNEAADWQSLDDRRSFEDITESYFSRTVA